MAMMTALFAPVLIGLAGGAVDFTAFNGHRAHLQETADAAAIAAAKEASLNGWSDKSAQSVVDGFLKVHTSSSDQGAVSANVVVDAASRRVDVVLEQDHYPYMVVGYFVGSPQIRVAASAQSSNTSNICVIGLETADAATISLQTNAVVSAPKCAVYSNSLSSSGLTSTGNALLTAQLACSAGGYSGGAKNYQTMPVPDCPTVVDPLQARPAPSFIGCDKRDADYQHFQGFLDPGVYCGGLRIRAASKVKLRAGVYVIKDGPLTVESNSSVDAKNVGFYFTGEGATFNFASGSSVDIEAPIEGPLAGIVAFQDRANPEADFVITSNDARKLLGTIYLPNGNLIIDANNKVADGSAYTAIVVRRLKLSKGPKLVLNTNYRDTLVPVPDGVGPSSAVRLMN